jgi:DNA-binding SARP family transcriptional activator
VNFHSPPARIYLLGRFALEVEGRAIDAGAFRRRRPVQLLTTLALAQGRALHREQLIDALWPEKDLDAGANNLHRALHDLRRITGVELVRIDHGVVRLDAGAWIDVAEFEQACSSVELARLAEGVALYQGDLLPDDPYADALAARRQALRQRFVDAALRLAVAHEQAEDHGAAIDVLRRALVVEPTLEPAHQGLMSALARSGRQREALQQFAECVSALHERLGVQPALATRKLRREIESGQLGPRPPAPAAPAVAAWEGARRLLGREQLRAVHGREGPLARVAEFVAGGRGALLITGEAGIGKTRLVAECVRAAPPGTVVLIGLSSELGAGLPYAPFADAFADLVRRGLAAAELDPFRQERQSSGSAQEDRLRLFQACERCLSALGQQGSVLLVIEDLQQADESSLYLFHHLARAARSLPLLLIGTLREEGIHVGQPLHLLLGSFGREQLGERIALEPLEADAIDAIVRDVLGAASPPPRETIHALADGNPFYAEELARVLGAPGEDAAPLRDLLGTVRERVRRLGRDAERLLSAAALVGTRFPFEIARVAAGLDHDAALDALELALEARILEEEDHACRFRHALTRKALTEQLTHPRRVHLHRKIAEALEAQGPRATEQHAEALAHHHEAAGGLERALPYLLAAAQRAQERLGLSEAAGFLARALEIMDAVDHADTAQRFGILRTLGGLQLALSDLDRAVHTLDAAISLSGGGFRPTASEIAAVERMAAMALIQAGRHGEAELRIARAIAALDGEAGGELTGALYLFGALRWHQERFQEAYDLAARALEEARGRGDARGMAKGHELLALACHALGSWREGQEHERARGELGGDTLDVDQAFDVHLCLWEYHLYGDRETRELGLRTEVERALALALRMGAPRAEALCRCFGGALSFQSGDWDAAEAELRSAVALFRRVSSASGESLSLQRLGVVLTARGRLDEARAALDEGIAVGARAAMRSHCLTRLYASLARNRLAAGDLPGAEAGIEAGLVEVARHGHCMTCSSLLLPEAVRVCVAAERLGEAEQHAARLQAVAAGFGSRLWLAMAEHARARVLAARGLRPAALAALESARQGFESAGDAYDGARCELLAAELAARPDAPIARARERLRALGAAGVEN